MAASQIVSQAEGSETESKKSAKSRSSVDPLAVLIVCRCHFNRICILWESILLGRVDVSDRISKMLNKSTESFCSFFHAKEVPLELQNQFLISCANSLSFCNLSINLIGRITQGNFNNQLCASAKSLLDVIEGSWIISGILMRKHFLMYSTFVQLFITSTQHGLFGNLNEVETCALKLLLSMLFYFIDGCSDSIGINEAHCCLKTFDILIESVTECHWISIYAKASKALVLQTVCVENANNIPISNEVFELLSEYILETVGSSRDHYKGCSVMEVLKVYNELIFKVQPNRAKFEQLSLLSEKEVLTSLEEYEHLDGAQPDIQSATEWIHEGLLSDFNSTKPSDPEGNLLVVDNMFRAICNIVCDHNKVYSDISFDQVNIIKTLITTLLSIVISCEIKDKKQISNFIASDDTLIEAIILTLGSKGKFAIPPYGLLISMTMELIIITCIQYSSICCDKLACAGGLSIVISQLKELQNLESNKVNEVLLNGHVVILFKATQPDPYSSISKFGYGIIDCLVSLLTTSSDRSLRICIKLFFSVLPAIMDTDLDELPTYMQLKDDEASRLLDMLDEATCKDYVTEEYAEFTLAELLSCFTVLTKSNYNSLTLYCSGITKILFKVFESHHYNVQKLSLQVFISLVQFDSVCSDVFTSDVNILYLLKYLHQSPCITISFLAENALSYYKWNLDTVYGMEDCYNQYAYSCFLTGHYKKGITLLELCEEKHVGCKLLLGKLLFQQYRKEQRILEYKKDYFTPQDMHAEGKIKDCYDKASKTIRALGFCLDCNAIDDDGLDMLSIALLDYLRETTGLKEIKRCYLCLKRASVRKSHICPVSILRTMADKLNPTEASSSGRFVTTLTNRHSVATPKTETKWLLCDDCELKLSRNGEQQFVSQLFQNVFPQVKMYDIKYGTWLYEFCVGLFFRCMTMLRNYGVSNEKEIFRFNQACRKYLREVEQKDITTRASYLSEWDFFIYINVVPVCAHYNAREEILCSLLTSCFTAQYSLYDLASGSKGRKYTIYFCMVVIGNITFLVKFKPDLTNKFPISYSKIVAADELLKVPSEAQRWNDILPGVAANVKDAVHLFQSRDSEIGWGKVVLSQRHRTMMPPSCDDFQDDDTLKNLGSPSVSGHVGIFAKFLEESVVTVSLLPDGFSIKTATGTLSLPPGHIVMNHIHQDDTKNIVFLACGSQHDNFHYYAIVVQNNVVGKQEMIYGFHFHPHQEDMYTLFVPPQVEGANDIFVKLYIDPILPVVVELIKEFGGFVSFKHVAKIIRICNDVKSISVDRKCLSKTCWYCSKLCHNCMKPSTFGFAKVVGDTIYNHCSDHCQNLHFAEVDKIPVQTETNFELSRQPCDERLLLLITSVLPTKMSPNTILCLHIAVSENHANLVANVPYCILQLRTTNRNVFVSFYVTPEHSPGDPLWHCKHPDSVDSINNIRESGIIQQVLNLGLKQLGYKSLASFISNKDKI